LKGHDSHLVIEFGLREELKLFGRAHEAKVRRPIGARARIPS